MASAIRLARSWASACPGSGVASSLAMASDALRGFSTRSRAKAPQTAATSSTKRSRAHQGLRACRKIGKASAKINATITAVAMVKLHQLNRIRFTRGLLRTGDDDFNAPIQGLALGRRVAGDGIVGSVAFGRETAGVGQHRPDEPCDRVGPSL